MKKGNFLFGMFCGLLLAPVFYFALSYVKDTIREPNKDPIEQALTNLSDIRKATDSLLLGQQQETVNSGFLALEQYPGAQVVYQAQGATSFSCLITMPWSGCIRKLMASAFSGAALPHQQARYHTYAPLDISVIHMAMSCNPSAP